MKCIALACATACSRSDKASLLRPASAYAAPKSAATQGTPTCICASCKEGRGRLAAPREPGRRPAPWAAGHACSRWRPPPRPGHDTAWLRLSHHPCVRAGPAEPASAPSPQRGVRRLYRDRRPGIQCPPVALPSGLLRPGAGGTGEARAGTAPGWAHRAGGKGLLIFLYS
jgi:hypothetical protein